MTWHVIAKDKPEDLKGHDNTSTASVAVPKCGSSKPAVWPPVIQQTNLRMPWVPNAEPRRMASGLNPCPGTFRTPQKYRAEELDHFKQAGAFPPQKNWLIMGDLVPQLAFSGTSSFALTTLGLSNHYCCCCCQTPAQDLVSPTEPQKKTEPKLPLKQI